MSSVGWRTFVGALALALFAAPAFAQCPTSPVTVPSGVKTTIATAAKDKTFSTKSSADRGKLEISENGRTLYYTSEIVVGRDDVKSAEVTCETAESGATKVAIKIEPAPAAPFDIFTPLLQIFTLLFGLAVLLEAALTLVFRWRPVADAFNIRVLRPIVSVALAWTFIRHYDFDLVTALVNEAMPSPVRPLSLVGQAVTALVLAGGAAGVRSIMMTLGLLKPAPDSGQTKPPPEVAWLSVRANRGFVATGPIVVTLAQQSNGSACAGIIDPKTRNRIPAEIRTLLSWLLADPDRFPSYGGHTIANPSEPLTVTLEELDANGVVVSSGAWGPKALAKGAIVDIEIALTAPQAQRQQPAQAAQQ